MDVTLAYLLIVVGLIVGGVAIWTWIVVHQAATEAREYFRRQNIDGRIEEREADALLDEWESVQ